MLYFLYHPRRAVDVVSFSSYFELIACIVPEILPLLSREIDDSKLYSCLTC